MVHACSPANASLGLSYGAVLRRDHPTGKTILKCFQGGNTKEGEPGPHWQRRQRHIGCSALDMCLSAGALPNQLAPCAGRMFANFVCDPCVATAAYDRHQDSPLSRDRPARPPCRQPPCPMTDLVLYPVFMRCPTTAPLSGALPQVLVVRQLLVAGFVLSPCPYVLSHMMPQWMFFRPWT